MKSLLLVLGGYAAARYLEGQAQGVPLDQLFNPATILTPVSQLQRPPVYTPTPQQAAVAAVNTPLQTLFGLSLPGTYGADGLYT